MGAPRPILLHMSSNLNGANGLRGSPLAPAPSVRPAAGVSAVVRVAPAVPTEDVGAEGPLHRSGLPLEDVLEQGDLLQTRTAVPRGAAAMGMAQARIALLRHLPGDALAALDEVWIGAERSEEGWYLRAGALTVLGLPGEADRVAGEGLERRPASLALRFLQSVARSITGDFSGARVALSPALESEPADPVLRLQQAVVLGRQGHLHDAGELISAVQQEFPDHPALAWARSAVRALTAEQTRSGGRETIGDASDIFAPVSPAIDAADNPVEQPSSAGATAFERPALKRDPRLTPDGAEGADAEGADAEGADVQGAGAPRAADVADAPEVADPELVSDRALEEWRDPVEGAFGSLGDRLVRRGAGMSTTDLRLLMRALSNGGALTGQCTPEQAHAARTLIGQLLEGVRQLDSEPVIRRTSVAGLVAILSALRRGETTEALRLWQRSRVVVPPGGQRYMQALLDGAHGRGTIRDSEPMARSGRTDAGVVWTVSASEIVRAERDGSALLPVRFGLSLLREEARTLPRVREHLANLWAPGAGADLGAGAGVGAGAGAVAGSLVPSAGAGPDALRDQPAFTPDRAVDAIYGDPQGEATGAGWGGARAAAPLFRSPPRRADGELGGLTTLLCVVLASAAAVLGYYAAGLVLAAGAIWLGWGAARSAARLRARSGVTSSNDRSRPFARPAKRVDRPPPEIRD